MTVPLPAPNPSIEYMKVPGTNSAHPVTQVPPALDALKSTVQRSSGNMMRVAGWGPVTVQWMVSPDGIVIDGGGTDPTCTSGPVQTTNADAGPANARETRATPRSRIMLIGTIAARKS